MMTKNLTIRKVNKKRSPNFEFSSRDQILEKLPKKAGGRGCQGQVKISCRNSKEKGSKCCIK